MSDRLSAADAYAEICYREEIIRGLGVPGATFEQIASSAGVTDMYYRQLPPQITLVAKKGAGP